MKELVWCEGSLYSGDDAGVICKVEREREGEDSQISVSVLQWDCMLNLSWTTSVYSDVASLAVANPSPDKTQVLAANLICSQVVVGEVRPRRRTEEGLEVAAMLEGRAPVAVSSAGDLAVCPSPRQI